MKELNNYIEHTLLKPEATKAQLNKLFDEAINNNFLGVCINPVNVKYAKEYLAGKDIKIVTVIGFPLGANTTEIKAAEAKRAITDGADELDMVINVGALKDVNINFVLNDIKSVINVANKHVVKVIIETDLLTIDEIKLATELVGQAGADFVKTSTGFVKNGVGAKVEDVKIMSEVAKKYNISVKASGGIKTYKDAVALIEAGATRLGTSSGCEIIKGA